MAEVKNKSFLLQFMNVLGAGDDSHNRTQSKQPRNYVNGHHNGGILNFQNTDYQITHRVASNGVIASIMLFEKIK